ncbi:hypothetical protein, partial [Solemya velesiana gill symbiont]|uniref:hypothetical protein n=1 Tax=Solemya velesiana gill symbiont TaxID=1918948 RepID=UPI001C12B79F
LKLWSVREATYATAAYPLTNSVELHLEIEFALFCEVLIIPEGHNKNVFYVNPAHAYASAEYHTLLGA